jgi:hypothetical protein
MPLCEPASHDHAECMLAQQAARPSPMRQLEDDPLVSGGRRASKRPQASGVDVDNRFVRSVPMNSRWLETVNKVIRANASNPPCILSSKAKCYL